MVQMASFNLLNLDGVDYVISPEFGNRVQKHLGTLVFSTVGVESDRLSLLSLSNQRSLKTVEKARLDALTHVKNVANAIRVVGAHHDPLEEWGLDGWDAVHGNSAQHKCGCVTHHVFDHYSAVNHFGHNRLSHEEVEEADGTMHVVERYKREHHHIEPRRVCRVHAHLAEDPNALHEQVSKEA